MEEREIFTAHFSRTENNASIYFVELFGKLYPKTSLTTTQDGNFDLIKFLKRQEDPAPSRDESIEELELEHAIRLIKFQAAKRRREADGKCTDDIQIAKYRVVWNGVELLAIVAKWTEMRCGVVTQWHLIGDSLSASDLVLKCCTWCAELRNVVLVFDRGYWRPDENLWKAIQTADWNDVILDEGLKSGIRRDFSSFFQSEKTYTALQVPWKRGLILMGLMSSWPPGNGKTITLKAIMKSVGVPSLYVKSFKNPNGDEFGIRQIFARARSEAPCVLVLEDLDSLITEENRSFFLNEVDGLEDNDGLLLIGTTNHFEKLDPALSSRPSRFDRKYKFPAPALQERQEYTEYWRQKLSVNPSLVFGEDLVQEVAAKTDGFSFAYIKEIFVSALLTMVNPEGEASDVKNSPTPPELFSQAITEQIVWMRDQVETGQQTGMAASWIKKDTAEDTSGTGRIMRRAMAHSYVMH